MTETEETLFKIILAPFVVVFAILLGIVAGLWAAYCGHFAWNWLAVPILGLPVLTTYQMFALVLVWRAIRGSNYSKRGKSTDIFMSMVIDPPMLLFFAWLTKEFLL